MSFGFELMAARPPQKRWRQTRALESETHRAGVTEQVMETHMCVHKYTSTHMPHRLTHTHAQMHTKYMCTHMHTCSHIHTNTCVHTHAGAHSHPKGSPSLWSFPHHTHCTPQQEEEGDADGRLEVRGWGGDVPLREWPLGGGGGRPHGLPHRR